MVFQVRLDATKPEIKAAVETLFKVKVAVNTSTRKGKTKRFRGQGPAAGHQESDRDARRGPLDRRDDGDLSAMALKPYKPTTPGQRQLVLVDRSDCGRASRSRR